jgi:hypothetical protein
MQAAILVVFFWVPVLTPQILESKKDYHAIELVPTPVPENHEPQRQLKRPVLMAKIDPVDPPPAALRLVAPQPRPKPKVEDVVAPEVKVSTKKLDDRPDSGGSCDPEADCKNEFVLHGKLGAPDD